MFFSHKRNPSDLVFDHLVKRFYFGQLITLSDLTRVQMAFCNCVCEVIRLDEVRDKMLHKCMFEYAHGVTRCYTGVT